MKITRIFGLLGVATMAWVGGLSATIYKSDIYLVNKTDKPLEVSSLIKKQYVRAEYVFEGQENFSNIVVPAGKTVKIAKLDRNQRYPDLLDLQLPHSMTTVEFTLGGQAHLFDSSLPIFSRLTYSNEALGIKSKKLPIEVMDKGIRIYSKYVFGQLFHDVYMEVYPAAKYN